MTDELKEILSHPLVHILGTGMGILIGWWMTRTTKKVDANTENIQKVEKDNAVLLDARAKNDEEMSRIAKEAAKFSELFNRNLNTLTTNVQSLTTSQGITNMKVDRLESEREFYVKKNGK